LILLLSACGPRPVDLPCTPDQAAPYADGIPYLGVHADAGNSDRVRCESATAFAQEWTALEGLGLIQPNTFSPDGSVTYATTTNPEPEGCRLHAVGVETGEVRWCKSLAPAVAQGSVEVDSGGLLYVAVDDAIVSFTADGEERWRTTIGEDDGTFGLHFTPTGEIATVTANGVVALLDRADGSLLSSMSIPQVYGFVAPERLTELDLTAMLPDEVQEDIVEVVGDTASGKLLAAFLGAGQFCDNTLGVSPDGDLYVIGGGPDTEHGALVQIRVVDGALEPGWAAPTWRGSATSPSISSDGRWVVIGDGVSGDTFTAPEDMDGRVKVADIAACDNNTDADEDPDRCAFSHETELERWPMIGAPAIDGDGTVIFWELGLDWSAGAGDRDLAALGPDGIVWEAALPDGLEWTSVITVTDNTLIGTAARVTASNEALFTLVFPEQTEDVLVVLDRQGTLLFEAPVPDDAAATVTIGPDGSLYAGVFGLLSIMSVDDRPDLGLVRFRPVR